MVDRVLVLLSMFFYFIILSLITLFIIPEMFASDDPGTLVAAIALTVIVPSSWLVGLFVCYETMRRWYYQKKK